jgi:hypothetical protein
MKMNMIKKMFGLMFVAIGSAALFTACPGPGATDCEDDIDCLSTEACVQQQCLQLCESSDECFDDEECVDRPDGEEGMVCVADEDPGVSCFQDDDCEADEICYNDPDAPGSPVCKATCDGDEDCAEGQEFCAERDDSDTQSQQICFDLAGVDEACDAHEDCQSHLICDDEDNVCIDPDDQVFYHTVLIADATAFEADPEDARCEDTTYGHDTAGAKIMAVILRDADDGSVVAYGNTVGFNLGTGANFGDAFNVIDGTAPDHENECPVERDNVTPGNNPSNFYADAIVALGCDGELYVQFPTDIDEGDYSPIVLDESYEIEVREYGPYCSEQNDTDLTNPQQASDYYDVFLCRDGSDPVNSDETCDVLLAEAVSGIQPVTISLP